MRKSSKIISFFVGLSIASYAIGSFCALYVLLYNERFWAQHGFTPDLFYTCAYSILAAAVITLAAGVYMMIRPIFAPKRERKLILEAEGGTIDIGESSIESVIRVTLGQFPGIVESDVVLSINSRKRQIKATVYCGIYGGNNLGVYGLAIQEKCSQAIYILTGYGVRRLDVRFYAAKPRKKTRKEESR